MASDSQTTTDHDTIRKWAQDRGGRPASVTSTSNADDAGLLRFDFQDKDEDLQEISWEEFFEKFDQKKLALLYQDKTAAGKPSRFFKFVKR